MSDIMRWLNWTPSEISSGTKWAPKPPKPPKPEAEDGPAAREGGSEGFGGACGGESQIFQPEPHLPWPGYNGGKQFACEKCGTRFDTSAGFAKHSVYGCVSGKEIRP